ncbi:hypothetical protein QOZ80_3BG0289570 [Eleusine coracana subsp. coracana]|nr:hypothetical protein QOZ80_3BG0289570 [Eleusine coracana subsp. coracana]
MSKALEEASLCGTTPTSSASPPESKKREKTVPHYLRASTGSCHDLCKHGHKNPSEEEVKFSGGRRKKLPTHLNNLALNRSAILDRSKDVRNKSLSLAKSSISLGEAERVAPKLTSSNRKGTASNKNLVPRTTASAEHKILNYDGSKKHSVVAEKAATNLRYSYGVPKCDKKETLPSKVAIYSAKLKIPEKALPEQSRTVDKVTSVKHSLLKRPASSSAELNMVKKVSDTSQASSHHLLYSKDRSTLKAKGKVASPAAVITRVRAKPGQSPMRSSNATTHGKGDSDTSRSSFSMESKLTASVEIQEKLHVTGYSVESIPAQPSLDATECIGNSLPAPLESSRSISDDGMSRGTEKSEAVACEASIEDDTVIELQHSGYSAESIPAPASLDGTECVGNSRLAQEKSSKSISDDDMLGNTEKSEALACEVSIKGDTVIEFQESLDDKEFNVVLHEYPENELAEQNGMDGRALKDEDSQTDDASLCRLPENSTTMEAADAYDPSLTHINSEIEDDQVKINVCVEPLNANGKEEMDIHEDVERSVEILVLKKHVEEPESCLDFASGNAAENDKVDEVLDSRTDNCTSYCNSISETFSDGELLDEPKSVLIELSDSTIQMAAVASVSNEIIESEGLESRIIIPQLPEELSDDEFYEEYDFEFSESDESGTEDAEATINGNRDESVKASDQRPRRMAASQLGDTNETPYKLKFKRGKIVELPPDSSGPRRLKFRRKAANEILNSQSQSARRIYKRSSKDNVVPANPDVQSSSVKLRHQDAQEKKDAQGLFNNVIEETACKLVESRKSKVKALVGAFETVISLQDGKPTSQTGNSQDSVQDEEGNAPEECE